LISKILNDKKYFKLTLLSIVLFSVVLNVILYFAGFYSISADESGRTIHAYKWITGTYEGIPTWLPFHTIIMGFGLKIFPDLFFTPRIIISIFGVLAFVSFIWLSHELFKDRYITLLSAVIALFYPSRVILSSVPLSESMFFFFVFSGIAFFTKWLNSKKNLLLLLSALAFAFSSSVRYEGWLFSASIVAVLIFFKKIKTEKVNTITITIVTLIGLIFPVYWFIYQSGVADNPFHFFYDVNKNFERSLGTSFFSILRNNYLTRFIHHNLIYLCFPGVFASFYLFLRDSTIRKWMSLILIPFIPLILISFTGRGIPTHNIWRIPELWNILLIPFTAYFIKNLDSFEIKYLKHLRKSAVPLIITVVLIYYSFHIYRYVGDENYFSKEELKIGRYVEQNLIEADPKSKILIEVPDWSYLHIIVASNNPENFIKSSEGGDPRLIRNPTITDSSRIDLAEIADKNIRFILVKSQELKNKIKRNPFFKEKKNFKEWSLYEIR
jgi:hypothetical protein